MQENGILWSLQQRNVSIVESQEILTIITWGCLPKLSDGMEMCSAMIDHWREKDHWFHIFERGQTKGWPIKKELWDGKRFSQYSWFFDEDIEWLLPTTCPHCKKIKKTAVIPA